MASEFSSQVPLSNVKLELLPLFHTCEAYDARSHIRKSAIDTEDVCEVFKDQITYMFYGKPSFKYKTSGKSSRDLSLYPVSFVLKADEVGEMKRIFPFDSGAMHHNFYNSFFNDKMSYLDFELEPNTNRIADIVLYFYGSNEGYVAGEAAKPDIAPSSFEAQSFAELIRARSETDADERRATIEVQGQKIIHLTNNSLLGIIVPTAFRDDPLFRTFAEQNSAIIESYDVTVWNPAQCFGQVQEAAKRLTIKMGTK